MPAYTALQQIAGEKCGREPYQQDYRAMGIHGRLDFPGGLRYILDTFSALTKKSARFKAMRIKVCILCLVLLSFLRFSALFSNESKEIQAEGIGAIKDNEV